MHWSTPHFDLDLPPGWQPHPNAAPDFGAVMGRDELIVSIWMMHAAPGVAPAAVFGRYVAHRRTILEQAGAKHLVELPTDWRDGDALSVLYGSLPDRHFFVTTFALESHDKTFHTTISAAFYRHAPIASYEELGDHARQTIASLAMKRT
jgi:hypothetical protein